MGVKTDCFAYDEAHNDCNAFSEMFCKKQQCKRYKSKFELSPRQIEQDIKNYSIKK